MKLIDLILPGLSPYLRARQNQYTADSMIKKAQKLDGLAALVGRFIPMEQFTVE
jgi:hypothetical protein